MKEPIIEAVGMVECYGTVDAVAGLDLVAHSGEAAAVVAPNRAGMAGGDSDLRATIGVVPDAEKEPGHRSTIRLRIAVPRTVMFETASSMCRRSSVVSSMRDR